MTVPTPLPPRSTETGLQLPSWGRFLAILGRILTLRCPSCGRGRAFHGLMRLHERCPACGLRFQRGGADYFGGTRFANLVVAELLFVILFVGALFATAPNVPWDALTYGGMAAMVVLPILLYPFSKLVWLGMDLFVRPATREELAEGAAARAHAH